jgi:hypothetical protein
VYLTYSRGGAIGIAVGLVAVLALSRNRWTVLVHALAATAGVGVVVLIIREQPEIVAGTGGGGGAAVAPALVAAGLVCAAVALFTGSTGFDRARVPRSARRWVATAGAAAIVVGLAVGAGPLANAWDEFRAQRTVAVAGDPAQRLASAGGTRADVWSAALDAFESEPVGGIGPGTFEFYWSQHAPVPDFLRDAHSLYLEELAELGIGGLLLLLAFLGGGLVLAIRARIGLRRPPEIAAGVAMCAGAVVFCVHAGIDWMWELTAVAVLGLAAIGTVLPARSERDTRRRLPVWARVTAVAVAGAAALIQVPGLASTARVREAAGELSRGRAADARDLDGDAVAAEPWAATPYASRAAAEARAGDYRAAFADLGSAIEREPTDWRLWLARVQVQLAAGDRAAAGRSFERLRSLSLTSAVPYDTIGGLAFDPATKEAVRRGCLGYVYGACDYPSATQPLRCAPGRRAAQAIRDARGAIVEPVRAVSTPSGGGYYVAGRVDGRLTTWALDAPAYLTGSGNVIPLDKLAIDASTLGGPVDLEALDSSASDPQARVARACVRAIR